MSSHTASSNRITRIVVAAILATAVGVPGASFAQVPDSSPSITVKYSDLNLATPEGSRVLYQRLVDAAVKVCPQTGNAAELRNNRDARRCIAKTIEQTVKQIKSPQFAQVAAAYTR
ncbi:MAG: UrcA family protein [Gammaproteobacteria bacterium]